MAERNGQLTARQDIKRVRDRFWEEHPDLTSREATTLAVLDRLKRTRVEFEDFRPMIPVSQLVKASVLEGINEKYLRVKNRKAAKSAAQKISEKTGRPFSL